MYRIVVPLSADAESLRAVPWAFAIGHALDGEVILVWILEGDANYALEETARPIRDAAAARSELERLAAGAPCATRLEVVEGHAITGMVELVDGVEADLIVTAGIQQRFEEGVALDLTTELVRETGRPVLAVGVEAPTQAEPPRKILAPFDGTPLARTIFDRLAPLVLAVDAHIIVFYAAEPDQGRGDAPPANESNLSPVRGAQATAIEQLVTDLRARGLSVETTVGFGAPADAILRTLEVQGADCVALSTHSREGLARWFAGSVAEQVLADAPVPVILLHPTPELPEAVRDED
jgi:nucleotide-binding universal stress UspA family protein